MFLITSNSRKENNRKIQQVAATMAIEDMYMSKDCLVQGVLHLDTRMHEFVCSGNSLTLINGQYVSLDKIILKRPR